jgi:hypothetical protein
LTTAVASQNNTKEKGNKKREKRPSLKYHKNISELFYYTSHAQKTCPIKRIRQTRNKLIREMKSKGYEYRTFLKAPGICFTCRRHLQSVSTVMVERQKEQNVIPSSLCPKVHRPTSQD